MDADASPMSPAGWALRAERGVLDIGPLLERFGLVHRYPIARSERSDAVRPGQPCFLFRADPAVTIGIWAVGEVVGPCAPIAADFDHPAAGRAGDLDAEGGQLYMEVELLALEKPISVDALLADPVLARSALLADVPPANPIALSRAELRALEAHELWLTDPTDDQRSALDRQLAAEDAAGI